MAKKCDYYMIRSDGVILVRTYSTTNKYLKQLETGVDDYDEAIDIGEFVNGEYKPKYYTYIETDREIEERINL